MNRRKFLTSMAVAPAVPFVPQKIISEDKNGKEMEGS